MPIINNSDKMYTDETQAKISPERMLRRRDNILYQTHFFDESVNKLVPVFKFNQAKNDENVSPNKINED